MVKANSDLVIDPRYRAEVLRMSAALLARGDRPAGIERVQVPCAGASLEAVVSTIPGADGRPIILVMVARSVAEPLLDSPRLRDRYRLTPRELEVCLLLARRWSNKEIARVMEIRPRTACRHTENVLRKLSVPNRVEAARLLAVFAV